MVSKRRVNPALEQQRAEAKRAHRAAGKKVSRLKSQGADIAGTRYDPRRDIQKIDTYNGPQLQAYLNQIGRFLDRGTQYHQLGDGTIITGQEWNSKYKRIERTYNARVNKRVSEVEKLKLPSGQTIGNRLKTVIGDRRSGRGVGVNVPYDPPKRVPGQIKNRKALEELGNSLRKRVMTDHEQLELKRAQSEFYKMQNLIKDIKLNTRIQRLTPDQFRVLWQYTNFTTLVSGDYEAMKKMMTDGDAALDDVYEQQLEEANELAKWAKKNFPAKTK